MSSRLAEPAADLDEAVVAWRRALHRRPELSFEEHETAAWIAARLGELGLEAEHPTPTSVLARLGGGGDGPTVLVRADIDGLPVDEQTGLPFASELPGRMHGCGHDGHAAMLLGVARTLAGAREELPGELLLLFQHAEETPPGGASELVGAGVLDGVDAVLGAHLWSALATGEVAVPGGACTAGSDSFSLRLEGRGGHAGMPHQVRDPIVAAAALVGALQTVAARETDPLDSVVVSVTRIAAGSSTNVVPDRAELAGTVRAFAPHIREAARASIARLADGIAAAHGVRCEVGFEPGYEPVENDPALAAAVAGAAERIAGVARVVPWRPTTAVEDFSAYRRAAPGVFVFVGAGGEDPGAAYPHHHPRFAIDEDALAIGTRVLLAGAEALMTTPAPATDPDPSGGDR